MQWPSKVGFVERYFRVWGFLLSVVQYQDCESAGGLITEHRFPLVLHRRSLGLLLPGMRALLLPSPQGNSKEGKGQLEKNIKTTPLQDLFPLGIGNTFLLHSFHICKGHTWISLKNISPYLEQGLT